MEQPGGGGRPDEPSRRRPRWQAVFAALFAGILVLLAGAFLIDRQFRAQVGIEPGPTEPTSAPAVRDEATAEPTAAPEDTLAPLTPVPAQPSPTSVAQTPLEQEIEAAYLRFWEVRAQAYFDLDTSQLPKVMAGAELEREVQQIRDLQAQGMAVKVDVEHNFVFWSVAPEEAVVYDEYVNRSLYVDATTKQQFATQEPPSTEKISFVLQKINGEWKVVDGAQHE